MGMNWLSKQFKDMTPEEKEKYLWFKHQEELQIKHHEKSERENWNPFKR